MRRLPTPKRASPSVAVSRDWLTFIADIIEYQAGVVAEGRATILDVPTPQAMRNVAATLRRAAAKE